MIAPDGWIVVERLCRLWSDVPAGGRVTAEDLQEHPLWRSDWKTSRELERLTNPRCIIAVQPPSFNGKWMPCAGVAAAGHDLCPNHGGPKKSKKATKSELERLQAENLALRAQIEAAS